MTPKRSWLRPLVPAYAAALALNEGLRALGMPQVQRLPEVVISVGSLSAGGAGKTPLVLALAKALSKREYAVRILTRGYKRQSQAIERVDAAGDSARYGDEPLLIAQRSGMPVFVGADRYRAGLLAQELPETKRVVYLLDDGFQHRRLARSLDVVLLTAADVRDTLLPAGNLREPLSRLSRADVVVLREDEYEELKPFLRATIQHSAETDEAQLTQPAVWVIRRRLELPEPARLPRRPLAFCGIARPEGFAAMLASKGVEPIDIIRFPDHHRYADRDMAALASRARGLAADALLTTEKDAVKLTGELRSKLEAAAPLLIARLEVELLEERAAVEQMIRKIGQMNRRRWSPGR